MTLNIYILRNERKKRSNEFSLEMKRQQVFVHVCNLVSFVSRNLADSSDGVFCRHAVCESFMYKYRSA